MVIDYETADSVSTIVGGLDGTDDYDRVWIILKSNGRPVALVDVSADHDRAAAVVGDQLARVSLLAGPPVNVEEPSTRPSVVVVICTRDRPDDLTRLLDSLRKQDYPEFSVLVVDNASSGSETRDVVERYASRFGTLDYVREARPGLSRARNRALSQVDAEIIAWIDDDETADEHWLGELMAAFAAHPSASAVSGAVLPAELETWPQWWFEQYGGHTKGRGFVPSVFDPRVSTMQSALYPLPPFGAGANMAFRTAALKEVGGFDEALGAGTITHAGEDTLVFSQLLLTGHTVVYHPAACTRHYHRRSWESLEHQMHGYGVGLTAYYAALLNWNWRLIVPLIRLAPLALKEMFLKRESAITSGLPDDFPSWLLRLKQQGALVGPWHYVRARRRIHRESSSN